MKKSLMAASALLALLPAVPAAAQNIVTNGDFENTGLSNWTVRGWGTNINGVISGAFSASTGCVGGGCIRDSLGNYDTTTGAFIYQDLPTVAGTLYTLDFDFGAAGFTNELAVLFGGTAVFDQVNLTSANTHYTVSGLLAGGSTTRLMFLGRQDPSYDRLDNISVVATAVGGAVPEPATWGLMLLGFGAMGHAMRRRTRTSVRFA